MTRHLAVLACALLLYCQAPGSSRAAEPPQPTGAPPDSKVWAAQAPAPDGTYAYKALLVRMVKEKRIDALQTHFEDRFARHRQGELPDYQLNRMLIMASRVELAQAGTFDAWVEAYPDSFIGPLARAYFNNHRAWKARGSKFARETRREEFQEMDRWLALVRRDVQLALHRNASCALCYATLIGMSMPHGLRKEAQEWFTRGMAIDPGSFAVPAAYFESLEPRWGGSTDQQEALIAKLRLAGSVVAADRLQAQAMGDAALRCCQASPTGGQDMLDAAQASLRIADTYGGRMARAKALDALGRHSESVEVYTSLVHDFNASQQTFEGRAYAYSRLGRWAEAMRDLRIAYEDFLSPWSFEMLVRLSAGNSGWPIRTDPEEAPRLCKEAALRGLPIAMTCLGGLHYFGKGGVSRNLAEARVWFRRAADAGDPQGMMDLAQMYLTGQGGEADRDQTIRLWLAAAEKGHAPARQKLDSELSTWERFRHLHWPALKERLLKRWGL